MPRTSRWSASCAVQQAVPRITRTGLLENILVVGRTTQDIRVAEFASQNHVEAGRRIRRRWVGVRRTVAHDRQKIVVGVDVNLQREADLMQVADAGGRRAGFLARLNTGNSSAASMPMMAMTTSSSIRVKAASNRLCPSWLVVVIMGCAAFSPTPSGAAFLPEPARVPPSSAPSSGCKMYSVQWSGPLPPVPG